MIQSSNNKIYNLIYSEFYVLVIIILNVLSSTILNVCAQLPVCLISVSNACNMYHGLVSYDILKNCV